MERWTFGDFVLDLDTHELVRAGAPVSLSPKAFELLDILVENHPKALSKTELQDRLWPGTFVVEKNLTNLVSEIREALGDDPVHPRFIRTVHRFGYAFREARRSEARRRRRHNLPVPLTNFIGRDQEFAELSRLVASTRLLTLTGAGGCGKTRLALELAANVLDRFPDGVWVVDLAAISNPSLVAQTVASVLDVREGPNRPIRDALSGLRSQSADPPGPRQLRAPDCRLRSARGRAAPHRRCDLCILATSREGLGITGETGLAGPFLSRSRNQFRQLPQRSSGQYDAVRLFVERAAAVDPAFTVTAANAARGRQGVSPARWHPARDRAGRGSGECALDRTDRRPAERLFPPAYRREPHGGRAAAHARGNRGLELRPALGPGTPAAAAALGIRRGMDDGGGGGGDVG